jgi:hypothetical protein
MQELIYIKQQPHTLLITMMIYGDPVTSTQSDLMEAVMGMLTTNVGAISHHARMGCVNRRPL